MTSKFFIDQPLFIESLSLHVPLLEMRFRPLMWSILSAASIYSFWLIGNMWLVIPPFSVVLLALVSVLFGRCRQLSNAVQPVSMSPPVNDIAPSTSHPSSADATSSSWNAKILHSLNSLYGVPRFESQAPQLVPDWYAAYFFSLHTLFSCFTLVACIVSQGPPGYFFPDDTQPFHVIVNGFQGPCATFTATHLLVALGGFWVPTKQFIDARDNLKKDIISVSKDLVEQILSKSERPTTTATTTTCWKLLKSAGVNQFLSFWLCFLISLQPIIYIWCDGEFRPENAWTCSIALVCIPFDCCTCVLIIDHLFPYVKRCYSSSLEIFKDGLSLRNIEFGSVESIIEWWYVRAWAVETIFKLNYKRGERALVAMLLPVCGCIAYVVTTYFMSGFYIGSGIPQFVTWLVILIAYSMLSLSSAAEVWVTQTHQYVALERRALLLYQGSLLSEPDASKSHRLALLSKFTSKVAGTLKQLDVAPSLFGAPLTPQLITLFQGYVFSAVVSLVTSTVFKNRN